MKKYPQRCSVYLVCSRMQRQALNRNRDLALIPMDTDNVVLSNTLSASYVLILTWVFSFSSSSFDTIISPQLLSKNSMIRAMFSFIVFFSVFRFRLYNRSCVEV